MKILIIFTIFAFLYTMFMIHQTAKFAINKAKRNGLFSDLIDNLEAHWKLYNVKHKIEIKKIQESRIETVEAEEVIEIERPQQWSWTVENSSRLGERFAETHLIDK